MNRKERRSQNSQRRSGKSSIFPAAPGVFEEALRHHQAGRLAEAEQLYKKILAVDPSHANALHFAGLLAHQVGHRDIAVELMDKSIVLRGDVPDFHNNLGNVFKDQGRLDDAEARYRRAIKLKPDYAEAHYNLGTLLRDQDNLSDAAECFRQATVLKPDFAEAHINLGNVLERQNKFDDAIACYQQAIVLKPNFAEAYINIGLSLQKQEKFDDAVACYERALALKSDSTGAFNNLGSISTEQGKSDEAIEFYRRALALNPGLANVHSNILLVMVYMASVSPQELASAAGNFGRRVADPLLRARLLTRDVDPERKLRIGYVSPDFCNHSVNHFFEHLLNHHDRQNFEIFGYSSTLREDAITARLKQECDHWRNINSLNDDKAVDLIEADAIDILVDMAGHTAGNRLLVFARKPAPVQVTWLGYPATTGMAAMDYRITDVHAEPEGMTEHLNTEKLWRLPQIFCCYQAHENSPAVIDHPPFEDNGYITFGCFNNFAKVTDPVLAAWKQILTQVPESRLLLEIRGLENPEFRTFVETRLHKCGLPADRVILEPRKKSNQFVLYNKIDIALDPFPCAGGTTSMDTMWMGVPLVALAGEHFVSRMGVTILTNAGLPELIANNVDEYVALATRLALDKNRLRGMRHNLRDRVAKSPLMDQAAFARNLETAYREMWRKWCAKNPDEK